MNFKKINLSGRKSFILDDEITCHSIVARGSLDDYGLEFKRTNGSRLSSLGKYFYREYDSLVYVDDNLLVSDNAHKSKTISEFITDLIRFNLIKENK